MLSQIGTPDEVVEACRGAGVGPGTHLAVVAIPSGLVALAVGDLRLALAHNGPECVAAVDDALGHEQAGQLAFAVFQILPRHELPGA